MIGENDEKIKFVADSSCDMFELGHTKFEAAPMRIITAERELIDDASLDIDDMTDYVYRFSLRVLYNFHRANLMQIMQIRRKMRRTS